MIEELIAKVFEARNAAHLEHWRTKSYAEHQALGDFYDGIIDIVDNDPANALITQNHKIAWVFQGVVLR